MRVPQAFRVLRHVLADTRGASAVEYGLIVTAVMVAIFAGLSQLGVSFQSLLAFIADHLRQASG